MTCARENTVLELLRGRFSEWQENGFIPSRAIERGGDKTEEPIRTRGWTHWHHLFNPRQLLMHGLFGKNIIETEDYSKMSVCALGLSIAPAVDRLARLCGVDPHQSKGPGSTNHVFLNQALNTQYVYGARALCGLIKFYITDFKTNFEIHENTEISTADTREVLNVSDIWFTDPPYADAINYHELTDFFLSWYEKHLPEAFPDGTPTPKSFSHPGFRR